jgi:putative glutamine amidotransferase
MTLDTTAQPHIVVTVAVAAWHDKPALAEQRNALYGAAIERHGAIPTLLDVQATDEQRRIAFASMDGLLLSGGVDIHPARYGQTTSGAKEISRQRDELEAAAWDAAAARGRPVLGLCRGLQAINVFSGGSLLQHVDGHAGPSWGEGTAHQHPVRLEAGTRLAAVLAPAETIEVNSYHHQAVRPEDLAPGLVANAWADSVAGPLVEGLESADGRFVIGVQCHPERTESTPPAFEELFAAFVEAARESARTAAQTPVAGQVAPVTFRPARSGTAASTGVTRRR